ncbi:hypothetical protein GCM10028805_28950 [Spirosoma harenae]
MKKLIIYDDSCPMCRLYTKGMVSADESGCLQRIGGNQLADKTLVDRLDLQRARHEIPLIDLDGGETLYGVDTWIYALGQRNQSTAKLLSLNWFNLLLRKIYAFISYNRRIIITSPPGRWQLLDLQPDFSLKLRILFILVVFTLISTLSIIGPKWPSTFFLLVPAQILTVSLYLLAQRSGNYLEELFDYIGHLGMSLLVGMSIMTIGYAINQSPLILIGYALMIGQHFIRSYRLGLTPWLSIIFTVLVFLLFRPL